METNNEDQWVNDRLASIGPDWPPDSLAGRIALDERLASRRRSGTWMMTSAVAGAIMGAVIALPTTRAMAKDFWTKLVLGRADVVRLDLSQLPVQSRIVSNGVERSAQDVDEAEEFVGFKPHLPAGLPGSPVISVAGPIVAVQSIHVHDLESALAKVGATDVRVPPDWDGVALRADYGPTVTADYPDDVQIVQALPFSLTVPSGFALESFAEVAFRCVGASSEDARALARRFAANPALLLDIPPDKTVSIEELSLVSGPALLIGNFDHTGAVSRTTVFRSTKDRIYSVRSHHRDLSIKVAEALP